MGRSWRRLIVALVVLYSIEAIPNRASSSSAFSSSTPNPSTSPLPSSSSSSSPSPSPSSTVPLADGGSAAAGRHKKPNIIMILADDMGWNDVSFHGSNQIPTPNIDALAYNGIILNSHYVSALCTPSRAALLTGKYPIHLGMQHSVILEPEPRGLPLTEKLLPEYLKDAGYKTHAIGKWHLGYYKREFTPTYRGFDSHFGYWNGLQDYYSHLVKATFEGYSGFDMRRNTSVAFDTAGKYSTDLFTEEAVRLIDAHDTRNPLFMYLSHLAVHSGNDDFPLQAPDEEVAKFSHIEDPERRIYAAMVSKLDQSVGDVVSALRQRGMLENSIILFMSDNGAPTNGIHYNRGSNYPLRGIKDSPWEGGVRGVAAIWSPLIEKSARVSNQLIYVADWLPTLLTAAGIDTKIVGDIDGVDVWKALVSNQNSPRYEVLLNIDDISNYAAIRRGDFKYIIGSTKSGKEWYGETGRPEFQDIEGISPDYNPESVLKSKTGVAISGIITAKQVLELKSQRVRDSTTKKVFRSKMLRIEDVLDLRTRAEVKCNAKDEDKILCDPIDSPCLFDLKEDPCEMVNLAKTRPLVMQTLEDALLKYRGTMIPPSNIPTDARADPRHWNGTWVPWKDSDPMMTLSSRANFGEGTSRISATTIALIAVVVGLLIIGAMICIALRYVARKGAEAPRSHRNFQKVEDSLNIGVRSDEISRSLQNLRDLSILKDNINGRGIE